MNNNLKFENTNGKWTFNENVADCFEDMLKKSIPEYNSMRQLILNLGISILKNSEYKTMLDIGCSDGLNLMPFVKKYKNNMKYKGIDISSPMLEKSKRRFETYIKNDTVKIENMDLRNDFPIEHYSLITSILTIQFIPIEYRQKIIKNIYNNLNKNGGFIFVEKVIGSCSNIDNIMLQEYLKMKEKNGYSQEEILRKKKSLEGVLIPLTSNWNMQLLKQAGFNKIDVFWRWMNFTGYIAIK